jgi:uncharacterized protein (TIGR03083 family)
MSIRILEAGGSGMGTVEDEWALVAAERSDLADLGASLTQAQWDTPSLCDGWTVRHVFAHLVMGTVQDFRGLLPFIVRSPFDLDRASMRAAIAAGEAREPDQLVSTLRLNAASRKRLPGTTTAGVMAEALVHGQDIRRPLGVTRVPPVDRTVLALWSMVRTGFGLGNTKRIAGLRLVATDVDWSHGDGPEVRGPAETLLMATCGRRVALSDLDGPGVDTLRSR